MKFTFLLLLFPFLLGAQVSCGGATAFQVLHFTKTSGFDHRTRNESNAMFTDIGVEENFTVVNTSDESVFDDLMTLLTYEVIIFANTSGNIPFTATQRDHLRQYVENGGGVLGIHAATDMYRDASYPFFTKLIGGSRRNSPAHTSASTVAIMDKIGVHPSTTNLPDPWEKQEEYYYWPDTGLVTDIVEVLRVRDTGNNSFNDPRPISWYQNFPSGARSFYTALGHARGNYTDPNNDFRQHLRDALCWCVEARDTSLPVSILSTDLEATPIGHRINWLVSPNDSPQEVELHGGPTKSTTQLLSSTYTTSTSGSFLHRPTISGQWYYYRLRFFDAAGLATWSDWLAVSPQSNQQGHSIQYTDGKPWLYLDVSKPTAAMLFDASGRMLTGLQLQPGYNQLPTPKPGMYVIRLPFRLAPGLRYVAR
ncbi:MAG: ThuA domain-containing protein [Bacteroidota bacterium]